MEWARGGTAAAANVLGTPMLFVEIENLHSYVPCKGVSSCRGYLQEKTIRNIK